MRKGELAKLVAAEFGLTIGQTTDVLAFIFEEVERRLLAGGEYHHSGFGTFQLSKRKKRRIHNVNSGDYTVIPEKKTIRFTASRTLKRRLNGKRAKSEKAGASAKRSNPKRQR